MLISELNKLSQEEILRKAIKEKDVLFLARYYFNFDLSPNQVEIVRKITFFEYKRFSISAMTQYGKSRCVAIAIGLYLILNVNKQIYFLSPLEQQSLIVRNYLAELIQRCPSLLEITDLSATDEEKLTVQTSRAFQTFKTGNWYRVMTCHDNADNLMGHGINEGIIIVDEATRINNEAYVKIMRMLTSNPDNCMLVELLNPWTRDCKAFQHYIDPDFHKIHIDWRTAVKEGRTTEEFVMQQKRELTSIEFTVLYESEFPMEAEDSIFNLNKINEAIKRDVVFDADTRIISCDVADKGLDKTVIMTGRLSKQGNYLVEKIYYEDKSENVNIAGYINNIIQSDRYNFEKLRVFIDTIGLGAGVVSNVKQFVELNGVGNCIVTGCHYGEKPVNDDERFHNRKAESFFRLKALFDENKLGIPDYKTLTNELVSMKWKFSSTAKIVIVDPDKSPDFADCLVYFCWFNPEYQGGYLSA